MVAGADVPAPTYAGRAAPASTRSMSAEENDRRAEGAEDSRPDANSSAGKAPPRRSRWRIVLGLGVVALIAAGTAYWLETRDFVSTDDAVINGNVVRLSPRVSGKIIAVDVTDNQFVHRGDLIVQLDRRDYSVAVDDAKATLALAVAQVAVARAALALSKATTAALLKQGEGRVDHARAALAQARALVTAGEAQAVRTRQDVVRFGKLVARSFASRQRYELAQAAARSTIAQLGATKQGVNVAKAQLDTALGGLAEAKTGPQQVTVKAAELRVAEARVDAARAGLERARLNLSYTRIRAPHDGFITKKNVQPGDVVQRDQTLAALVFGARWVTADFKETRLSRIRPGQPVEIRIDAYPGHVFKGRVDSIQRGTGAYFSLLPPENATGNFVKVVQRVPVKIVFDRPPDRRYALGLGMSVEPTIDVGARPVGVAGR